MAKAQSFFGGTNPKRTGDPGRRVGNSSATPGANNIVNNSQQRRDSGTGPFSMRPPITRASSGGKGNNRQNIRHGTTKEAGRPNLPGKVDNRKVGL